MHGLVWAYDSRVYPTPPTGEKKIRSPTELALFVRIDNINYFNKSHDKPQQRGT